MWRVCKMIEYCVRPLMFLSQIVSCFTDPLIQASDLAETKGKPVFNNTSDHASSPAGRKRGL